MSLKPCPFCGSNDCESIFLRDELAIEDGRVIHSWYDVECMDCESSGPVGNSREDAKTKWNERLP